MNIRSIVSLKEVIKDLEIAKEFYEKQSFGLGRYFLDSILSDIESLWLYAGIHQKYFGFYRLLSKKFPFAIYYDIQKETAVIVAVLDLRQNPKNIEKFISKRE